MRLTLFHLWLQAQNQSYDRLNISQSRSIFLFNHLNRSMILLFIVYVVRMNMTCAHWKSFSEVAIGGINSINTTSYMVTVRFFLTTTNTFLLDKQVAFEIPSKWGRINMKLMFQLPNTMHVKFNTLHHRVSRNLNIETNDDYLTNYLLSISYPLNRPYNIINNIINPTYSQTMIEGKFGPHQFHFIIGPHPTSYMSKLTLVLIWPIGDQIIIKHTTHSSALCTFNISEMKFWQ